MACGNPQDYVLGRDAEDRAFLTVRTEPGRRDELRALWDQHLRPRAEANPAQELYLYCYDASDPDLIHMVEVYDDRSERQRNASAPWFAH